jgi:hypothetical protein
MKELGEMRRAFPQAETGLTSLYNKRKTWLLRKRDTAARSLPDKNRRDEGAPPFLPSFVKTNAATYIPAKIFLTSKFNSLLFFQLQPIKLKLVGYQLPTKLLKLNYFYQVISLLEIFV